MNNDLIPQGQSPDDYELREEYNLSQLPVVARGQQRSLDIKQPTKNIETLADFLGNSIGALHSSEHIPGTQSSLKLRVKHLLMRSSKSGSKESCDTD